MRSFLKETRVEPEKVDLLKMLEDTRIPREHLTFEDLKKNKTEFAKFRKFCKPEDYDHFIQFVLDCQHMKEIVEKEALEEQMEKIFNDYISPIRSETPIQLSNNTFALVILKYKAKDSTLFDKAQEEIARDIVKSYLKFKDSKPIKKEKVTNSFNFDEELGEDPKEKRLIKGFSFKTPRNKENETDRLLELDEIDEPKEKVFSTPLVSAVMNGDAGKVSELLKKNEFHHDDTLLHLAINCSHAKVVELLISNGFRVNSADKLKRTPLHMASNLGNLEIVLNLLGNGANVNVKDLYGFSPIMLSIKQHHWEVSENLILFGADLNFKKDNGLTILHESLQYGDEECLDFVLKNEKVKLNSKDQMGQTPLLRSLERSPLSLIKRFMEIPGVDIQAMDNNSKNMFHFATRNQRNDFLEYVLLKDDISKFESLISSKEKLSGQNPLHYAIRYGNLKTIKLMISLFQRVKADLFMKDSAGDLPSSVAEKSADKIFKDYVSSNEYIHLDKLNSKIQQHLNLRNYFKELENKEFPTQKKRTNSKHRSGSFFKK
jgi:ankyrin repeat protein